MISEADYRAAKGVGTQHHSWATCSFTTKRRHLSGKCSRCSQANRPFCGPVFARHSLAPSKARRTPTISVTLFVRRLVLGDALQQEDRVCNPQNRPFGSQERSRVPLPPLAEQRRSAEVLDQAEALRAKRRAALAQLDTLTQSIFLDMFGDPGSEIRRVGPSDDDRANHGMP